MYRIPFTFRSWCQFFLTRLFLELSFRDDNNLTICRSSSCYNGLWQTRRTKIFLQKCFRKESLLLRSKMTAVLRRLECIGHSGSELAWATNKQRISISTTEWSNQFDTLRCCKTKNEKNTNWLGFTIEASLCTHAIPSRIPLGQQRMRKSRSKKFFFHRSLNSLLLLFQSFPK